MKIVSKYKDYYDTAMSMGIDKTIVYERFQKEMKFEKPPNYDKIIRDLYLKAYGSIIYDRDRYPWNTKNKYQNQIYIIGFCGKLYLAYNFQHRIENQILSSKTFYSAPSVLGYITEIEMKHNQQELVYFTNDYDGNIPSNNQIRQTFEQNILKQDYNN
jgi:hypothetical protein